MLKFTKKSDSVMITNFGSDELHSLLKINVPCRLNFIKNNHVIDFIDLVARTSTNNIPTIMIKNMESGNKRFTVDYNDLYDMIKEGYQKGILTVSVKQTTFQEKEPLLLMLKDLNQKFISSCVTIDYDQKIHMFSIINQDINGISNKIYFFEDNSSILAFGVDGPSLIYDKVQSVEDIICN